jgi:hypothetical protein
MIERLHIPMPFRPLDFLLFGLIAIQLFALGIIYTELDELRRTVNAIQWEARR